MGRVPARCILLLEDLDAAFTRSVTREEGSGSGSGSGKKDGKDSKETDAMSDTNSLSLSGLLNALDGVAASEGRLLCEFYFSFYSSSRILTLLFF